MQLEFIGWISEVFMNNVSKAFDFQGASTWSPMAMLNAPLFNIIFFTLVFYMEGKSLAQHSGFLNVNLANSTIRQKSMLKILSSILVSKVAVECVYYGSFSLFLKKYFLPKCGLCWKVFKFNAVLHIFRHFFVRITAFEHFPFNLEGQKYPGVSRASCVFLNVIPIWRSICLVSSVK